MHLHGGACMRACTVLKVEHENDTHYVDLSIFIGHFAGIKSITPGRQRSRRTPP
jgi:hypothetical protein